MYVYNRYFTTAYHHLHIPFALAKVPLIRTLIWLESQ